MEAARNEALDPHVNLDASLGKRQALPQAGPAPGPAKRAPEVRGDCPFLSTIRRHLLDFDHEKFCSVSMTHKNVYCCLVCGKFFQGRGRDTFAYTHALEQSHYLFINLLDRRVYCLPENYEVTHKSLEDIKFNLKPQYSVEDIQRMEAKASFCKSIDGRKYLQGCVGLNNLHGTDYINVVLQSLIRVKKLRTLYLMYEDPDNLTDEQKARLLLSQRMAQLFKKVWNPINLKNHVSPHELVQAVSAKSGKQFGAGKRGDPVSFFTWLANSLHQEMKDRAGKSVIFDLFQGELEVVRHRFDSVNGRLVEKSVEASAQPFLLLTLDLPPMTLFKQDAGENSIPQELLADLFAKYGGKQPTKLGDDTCFYRIKKLPQILAVCVKRFVKNSYFVEKNPSIVITPLAGLDLRPYLADALQKDPALNANYRLISNVVHDGKPEEGTYRAAVYIHSLGAWMEMQDLYSREVLETLVEASQGYLMFFERVETN